ncbi:MAG: enoyl-CoA hydratase/isomerase family protein [Myxococcota bacterium]
MSENVVPWSSRVGPWQARVGIRRAVAKARESFNLADGPAPLVRRPVPPLTFDGKALRWKPVSVGDAGQSAQAPTILDVELHRTPCNEIGTTCLDELEQLATLVRAGAGGARALVVHSSVKRGFCAGADLRELYEGLIARGQNAGPAATGSGLVQRLGTAQAVRGFIDRIHAVFNTLDMAPITTVAAVNGVCFGGGFELALTADVIIADKSARFAFPELRLGLVPGFGGIPRLRRDLGNAVVRDLLMTGRSMGARRAYEVGLVSQLVQRGQAHAVAMRVAEQATRFDAQTTAHAKRFAKPFPRAELEREKDLFIEMMASPVVEAALKRFVESTDVRPYLP